MNKNSTIETGGLILSILIICSMFIPMSCRSAKESDVIASCKGNIKQIATACAMYSMSHSEQYPPELVALVPDQVSDPHLFWCRADIEK